MNEERIKMKPMKALTTTSLIRLNIYTINLFIYTRNISHSIQVNSRYIFLVCRP